MSTQLETKQRTLAQMLAANKLTKIASDQTVKHMSVYGQKSLGKEQTSEINENIEGVLASTPAAANKEQSSVDTPPNCQNLNTTAESALSRTGTKVNQMNVRGDANQMPKSATYYRNKLASIINMRKQASFEEEITTGSEVMAKIASYNNTGSDQDAQAVQEALYKIASTNPVFQAHYNNILLRKLAADIDELAQAEGISQEQAAELLDQAAEQDKAIEDDVKNEAATEAAEATAADEEAAVQVDDDLQTLADNASANLGTEVSKEDIANAIQEVNAQADAMGVPPEALIEAAMQQIQGAEADDVSDEDLESAQAILDEAAKNGVSPEEVIESAAADLGEGVEKSASYNQGSPRVAYIRSLIR